MTHFPTHVRNAFLEWIDGGFAEATTVEERYITRRISADELLRWFMLPTMCSDVLPGHACDQVAAELDYLGDVRGMTYGLAASALFVHRTLGDDAGSKYLAKLCEPLDEPPDAMAAPRTYRSADGSRSFASARVRAGAERIER